MERVGQGAGEARGCALASPSLYLPQEDLDRAPEAKQGFLARVSRGRPSACGLQSSLAWADAPGPVPSEPDGSPAPSVPQTLTARPTPPGADLPSVYKAF